MEVWLEFPRPKPLYQECFECYHELLCPCSCASRDICSCLSRFLRLRSCASSPLPSRLACPQRAFQQRIHVAHTSDTCPTEKSHDSKSSRQLPFHQLKHFHQGITQPLLLGLPKAGGEKPLDTSYNVTFSSLARQKEPVSDKYRDTSSLPFTQIQPSIPSACFSHSNPQKIKPGSHYMTRLPRRSCSTPSSEISFAG